MNVDTIYVPVSIWSISGYNSSLPHRIELNIPVMRCPTDAYSHNLRHPEIMVTILANKRANTS